MRKLKVSDIEPGGHDETQSPINCVYSINDPLYAIYGTDTRVSVQFADEPLQQRQQRADFAALAPLRGEINGLVDGWRTSADERLLAKVKRYDRTVADALVVALTRDCASAQGILRQIRDDLVADRTSLSRLYYLLTAGGAAAFLILSCSAGAWIALHDHIDFWGDTNPLWMGAGTGSIGAFFSIALALHTREFKPEQRWLDNVIAAVVRVLIGAIAGTMLVALISIHMVNVTLGDASFGETVPGGVAPALLPLIVAFLGGFAERLVPDLLKKAGDDMLAGAAPSAPPRPAGGAGDAPGGGAKDDGGAGGTPAGIARGAAADTGDGDAAQKRPPTGGGGAPVADEPGDDDQSETEACLAHAPVTDEEATPDDQLPPATGGVAQG